MIEKISTGPSDSFHRDEHNPGQEQAHFQYPLVHVFRITERTGATNMPRQIDVRGHRKCNDHDSLSISQHGSRGIVRTIVCRHSSQYVGISTLPRTSDLTFLILNGGGFCARLEDIRSKEFLMTVPARILRQSQNTLKS